MKILYGLLLLSFVTQTMLRPARPSRIQHTRSHSTRTSFQIKITNPKLLASLEAARHNVQPTAKPEQAPLRQKKGPTIASSYGRSSSSNHSRSSHSSVSDSYIPSRVTPADMLAYTASDAVEGYLEYKAYKKVDEILFEHPAPLHIPHLAPAPEEDDGDED